MSRHNFFYFAREGAYNMFNHGFMSFAAIGVTVACLLIMGTFTLVAVNANAMLEDMEQKNQVLAFVDENLTEEEARALADDLEAVDNVRGLSGPVPCWPPPAALSRRSPTPLGLRIRFISRGPSRRSREYLPGSMPIISAERLRRGGRRQTAGWAKFHLYE